MRLDEEQLGKLSDYLDHLLSRTSDLNLIGPASPEEAVRRHFIDSLSALELDFLSSRSLSDNASLIDIGTGAGFPGICLAVAKPQLKVTLVESTAKKCHFLQEVVNQTGLSGRVEVINERAEKLAHESHMRGGFDLATTRAVAELSCVAELALPFLKQGGRAISYKTGEQARPEQERLVSRKKHNLKALGGGDIVLLQPHLQMGATTHTLIVIRKVGVTNRRYPRSWASIKKSCDRDKLSGGGTG